ncbi:DUF2280 domain-containing protein [Burkholderia ubonensis]|uniref:DUF2280 domain-containing protein n=1 Tax=Burkholderia ubonensis TaxID=101571 RepID=UPI0009B310E5|nr:DUF2280 domain-containing protein [Burkholderia ubonensis]
MAALPEPIKVFVTQALACFDTPSRAAKSVREEFRPATRAHSTGICRSRHASASAAMDKQRRRRLCLWWSRLLINPPLFRSARAPEMPLPTMR